jgi:hypothetical protein
MDWMTFVSKMTDALAWPVAAIFIFWTLRGKVGDLIPALKRLKAGPLEAEFSNEAKRLVVEAKEAAPVNLPPLPPPASPPADPSPIIANPVEPRPPAPSGESLTRSGMEAIVITDSSQDHAKDHVAGLRMLMAEVAPVELIIETWGRVELELLAFGRDTGVVPVAPALTNAAVYKRVMDSGYLSPELSEVIRGLKRLRDKAVHDGFTPAGSATLNYVEGAELAVKSLRAVRQLWVATRGAPGQGG